MKAMAIHRFGDPLERITIEDPVAGYGEAVLRVTGCGVCRTDLKVMRGQLPVVQRAVLPLVPGHEIVGVVESLGPEVDGWSVGDRAVVSHFVGCGTCAACREGRPTRCLNIQYQIGFNRNGGYAEKVKVPARNLVRIAPHVPDAEAAVIPDAVATAVHAVVDRARVGVGDKVLVIGAGGVGLHAAQMAMICGAHTTVVDVDEEKVATARGLGVDDAHRVGGLDRLPPSLRVNKVIEASGALRDFKPIGDILERGGTLVLVGYTMGESLTANIKDVITAEFEIKGSRAAVVKDLAMAVDLVERGKLRPVIDTTVPLTEANEALARLEAGEFKGRAVLVP